jgi:hypothetical protein
MPLTGLTGQEKDELQLLVELDEPEAVVATLTRIAKRHALEATPELARRWTLLANALLQVEFALNAAQSPEALKLEAHMAEWAPQQAKPEGETA